MGWNGAGLKLYALFLSIQMAGPLILSSSAMAQRAPAQTEEQAGHARRSALPGPAPQTSTLDLDFEPQCATTEAAEHMQREIQLRLPHITIRGSSETVPQAQTSPTPLDSTWRLHWRRALDGTGCHLHLEGPDTQATLPLAQGAQPASIESAASRLAWLVNFAAPPPSESELNSGADAGNSETALEKSNNEDNAGDTAAKLKEDLQKAKVRDSPPAQAPYTYVPIVVSLVPGLEARIPSRLGDRVRSNIALALGGTDNAQVDGLALSFLFNRQQISMRGLQIAVMGINIAKGEMQGLQVSSLGNFNDASLRGVSASYLLNVHQGDIVGGQLAGLFNLALGRLHGLQMAGLLNIATEELYGAQVGTINIGHRVRGLQLGLINVAETSDASLGLINVITSEPLYLTGWMTSAGTQFVSLQHGGRYLRCMWGLSLPMGFNNKSENGEALLGVGFGLSGHVPFNTLFLDIDALLFQIPRLFEDEQEIQLTALGQFKLSIGWAFSEYVAAFAGPSLSIYGAGQNEGYGVPPSYAWQVQEGPERSSVWIWPEVHLGLRF